jgi:hypothetical protein
MACRQGLSVLQFPAMMTQPLALLAVLFLAVPSSSQGPPPNPNGVRSQPQQTTSGKDQQSGDRAQPAKQPPATTADVSSSSEGNGGADDGGAQKKAEATINERIATYTGWLVAVGLLQFVAMVIQAVFIVCSLKVSRIAADAATSASETAKRAFEMTERADVLIEMIDLIGEDYDRTRHSRINAVSICRVNLRNYGRTRAEDLTVECTLVVEFVEPIINPTVIRALPMILGAGKPFELRFLEFASLGFDQSVLSEIHSGKWRLHVASKLAYSDVFGKQHSVGCIGFYNPTNGEFTLTHYEGEFRMPHHETVEKGSG